MGYNISRFSPTISISSIPVPELIIIYIHVYICVKCIYIKVGMTTLGDYDFAMNTLSMKIDSELGSVDITDYG